MSKFLVLILISISKIMLAQSTNVQINNQKIERLPVTSLKATDTAFTYLSLQTGSNQNFIMIGVPEEEVRQVYKDGYISSRQVFVQVENMPIFPGGEVAIFEFLGKNIMYPQFEKENGIDGTVYVYFVINKNGYVQDAKVVRGVKNGFGLGDEALRVIKNMPKWTPGTQNGLPVNVQFTMPVKFVLREARGF